MIHSLHMVRSCWLIHSHKTGTFIFNDSILDLLALSGLMIHSLDMEHSDSLIHLHQLVLSRIMIDLEAYPLELAVSSV